MRRFFQWRRKNFKKISIFFWMARKYFSTACFFNAKNLLLINWIRSIPKVNKHWKNQKWRDVESILFLKLAGPLMPRSIIITEDQLLLVDEDYTRWPSIGIESELPKMPQFQKKFAHMISDVVNIVRKVINRNKINETKTQHIL